MQDPTQAAVPGAKVILKQAGTGRERTVETDASGNFVASGLEAGEYQIAVSMDGFKRAVQKNIRLATGERLPAGTIVLEVWLVVRDGIGERQLRRWCKRKAPERADVITGEQADRLLTLGRNVVSLVSLLPGVVDRTNNESLGVAMDLHVLGGRQRANNIAVDGAPAIDIDNGFGYKLNVSQDAVAEVKILVSNYQAEYGRMAGSNIQVVTKSGARDFHGMGSYFKRHEQFNASNFFDNRLGRGAAALPLQHVDLQHRRPHLHSRQIQPEQGKTVLFLAAGILADQDRQYCQPDCADGTGAARGFLGRPWIWMAGRS